MSALNITVRRDGVIVVTDAGRDDVMHAARKILKEKHGSHGAFYAPIPYGRPTVF